jgi:O-antigen/teichoic acid export membrane protein
MAIPYKRIFSGALFKNMGWLGSAEIITRIFRIGTTLTLPRILTPHDYGVIAIILTLQEFITVLESRRGYNAKLIQCKDEELPEFINTTYTLNIVIACVLFLGQCALAYPLTIIYKEPSLLIPVIVLALNYLFYPLYGIEAALVSRSNDLKLFGVAKLITGPLTNLLTLGLAVIGYSYWAVVIPTLVGNLIWVGLLKLNVKWEFKKFGFNKIKEIINFGLPLLGAEGLDKLRANLDYLIIGQVLGVEALGVYYFAFNAGLGISLSLISVFQSSFYPNIARYLDNWEAVKKEYWKTVKLISYLFIPMICLQVYAAPYYVPILFGTKWVSAIPVIAWVCVSAIPRPFKVMVDAVLQLRDRNDIIFEVDLWFTLIFAMSIYLISPQGIVPVAIITALVHLFYLGGYCWFISKKIGK